MIDVGEAGELEVGREELVALYQSGELVYHGALADEHVATLGAKVKASLRVSRRFKQMLEGLPD